ncbi:helix-hairpin-helix domain-containing protein [Terriglobus roseus]|nr:helix-hairpin-helix domain-containing protein [Terriglobus roseus]
MRHAKQLLASLTIGLPMLVWGVSAGSAVAAAAPAAYAQDAHPELPPGPGRDVTLATCTKCHAISNVTGQHKDRDGWTATITKMVGYGATGTDDDFGLILDYVTKNFGLDSPPAAPAAGAADAHAKIVVNKETAAQLTTDLGLTDDEAKAVVSYREKNGDYKTIDDLKKVPNVDAKKFDAKKDDLLFS